MWLPVCKSRSLLAFRLILDHKISINYSVSLLSCINWEQSAFRKWILAVNANLMKPRCIGIMLFIPGPAKFHWNAEWIVTLILDWIIISIDALSSAKVLLCKHTAKTHHVHSTHIYSTCIHIHNMHLQYTCLEYVLDSATLIQLLFNWWRILAAGTYHD